MFDFGDEFILDNNRIPWLIWIQILVMFLLTFIILFTYFVLDSSPSNSLSTVSPTLENPSSCSGRTQVGGNHGKEMATTTSCQTRHVENNSERDGNSSKDLSPSPVTRRFFHPCTYFDFAKQAFLKCLGLGSGSNEHEHEN
ncbi:uncharacterized protein LOC130820344 isoform X1 [Amaranthus tricolor]|uniref:uncharacterized protein LOC130820344 isoform X1 n=1 Tax=Amaranthus tricolor TaxID=29722 RepID=UPI00258F052A|nr:uncharacterized protein LOC130820344 isoform X1 [Amaranthus tricolor]